MTVRVGINGFGRIGRQVARILATAQDGLRLTAINTGRGDPTVLAHLLKYDTVHGRFPGDVRAEPGGIVIGGQRVPVTSIADPARIGWGDRGVDVVVEATGKFRTGDAAGRHLAAGAERVLVTAPMEGEYLTLVVGVNERTFDPARHRILSGASCTTACLGPVARVLDEAFGIVGGMVTTVHSYTRDQELVDGAHDDLRRGRSAALNIIPTTSGAARALGKILPALAGKLEAIAVRVPAPNVSLLDLSVVLRCPASAEQVNVIFQEAASSTDLSQVLGVTDEPVVSSDLVGDSRSAVVDLQATRTAPGNQVKVLAWYDNEFAYASRTVDLVRLIGASEERRGQESPAALAAPTR